MLDWIKGVMNSPEFLSTITGSVIGGIITILMFFLQNNEQKKFLKQQKTDDEERLQMQNQFQEQLLKIQNEFYQETVEIREKYERERMLIGFLKEKIEILNGANNDVNKFIHESKGIYKQAVENNDKNALKEWTQDFNEMHDSLIETVSNIDLKRLNEKVDGKTYHEMFEEIINHAKLLIGAVRKHLEIGEQIDLQEGLRNYSQIAKLTEQSRLLLIIEKNKIFDMLEL